MLHDFISKYLSDIEQALRRLENAYVECYEEEILSDSRINLRIRIRFLNNLLLEINEAIIIEAGEIRHLGYRYHFQGPKNNLLFRYDNTPHFPNLESFPHHKHLESGVIASDQPSVLDVIEEAKLLVS